MQVVQVLKKIAQAGCAVLFTIHQPSSDVFNSFDRLLLLNRGRVLYQVSYIAAVQQVLRPLHKCSFCSVGPHTTVVATKWVVATIWMGFVKSRCTSRAWITDGHKKLLIIHFCC